jgi:cytochrome c
MRLAALAIGLGAVLFAASCEKKPEAAAGDTNTALAALPAPFNAADLANGKKKFVQCSSCHTIKEGGANLTGPNLHGIFGKKIGEVPEFKYSEAAQAADFVWDGHKLDEWLTKPRDFLPGTKMSFPGMKEANDRRDVIAYLMIETAK